MLLLIRGCGDKVRSALGQPMQGGMRPDSRGLWHAIEGSSAGARWTITKAAQQHRTPRRYRVDEGLLEFRPRPGGRRCSGALLRVRTGKQLPKRRSSTALHDAIAQTKPFWSFGPVLEGAGALALW